MMREPWDANDKAALGGGACLEAIASRLEQDQAAQSVAAHTFAEMLTAQAPPDSAMRARLLSTARSCQELGDFELAEAFRIIAGERSSQSSRPLYLHVRSRQKRTFRLLRHRDGLKSSDLALEVQSGELPAQMPIQAGVSYLLRVSTATHEPDIAIPLCIDGVAPLQPIDIDLEPWAGVGKPFLWLPPTRCSVGGDLGARDPLRPADAIVGPSVVNAFHVRLSEYLSFVDSCGAADEHIHPSFMGAPLLRRDVTGWKPRAIAVKPGHDWQDVPAVGVDFECARRYCASLTLPNHLVADVPSEREWEVLARGPDRRLFPWGDVFIVRFANIRLDGEEFSGLEKVGSRRTDHSAFGLFDCSGNAEEWCSLESVDGGFPGYAVARGGSFYNPMQASRLASRVIRNVEYRHRKLTFRIAIKQRDGATLAD